MLPSSEKHALLAEEYYQSNIAVTFCTLLQKDFILHTNTGIRYMFKSTNDEIITWNIYEINSCMQSSRTVQHEMNTSTPYYRPARPCSVFAVHLSVVDPNVITGACCVS